MHVSEIGIFLSSSTESPRLVQPQTKIHTDLYLSGSFKPRNSRLFQQLQNSFIQITYPLKKKCLLQYSSPCWSYLTFTPSSWNCSFALLQPSSRSAPLVLLRQHRSTQRSQNWMRSVGHEWEHPCLLYQELPSDVQPLGIERHSRKRAGARE